MTDLTEQRCFFLRVPANKSNILTDLRKTSSLLIPIKGICHCTFPCDAALWLFLYRFQFSDSFSQLSVLPLPVCLPDTLHIYSADHDGNPYISHPFTILFYISFCLYTWNEIFCCTKTSIIQTPTIYYYLTED